MLAWEACKTLQAGIHYGSFYSKNSGQLSPFYLSEQFAARLATWQIQRPDPNMGLWLGRCSPERIVGTAGEQG